MSDKWASWWKRSGRLLAMLCWLPLVPLVVVGVTAYRTAELDERHAFQSSVLEQRTRLIRAATQIEMAIGSTELSSEWQPLKADPRVRTKWLPTLLGSDQQLYAAIVDPAGRIIIHSDPQAEGQPIGVAWYDQVIPVEGFGVFTVKDGPLSQGRLAYNVRVPIFQNGLIIGELHSGLSAEKLDVLQDGVYWGVMKGFLLPTFTAVGIAILAYFALAQLAISNERCHRFTTMAVARHSRELEQIAGGLAHEIRNPLHAIRMNLHVLNKWYSHKTQLSPEDLASTLSSSTAEVDRVEQIVRDLLRYAIPELGKPVQLNLVTELQATVNLMREDLRQKEIELVISESLPATWVNVDSSVFRQILIDILTFSQNKAGPQGRIDIAVTHQGPDCDLNISDHGATLSESQRAHLFEPFQATQQTGSSLGLALVKSSVEQAGGSIQCVDHLPRGNSIRMRFPRQSPPHSLGAS